MTTEEAYACLDFADTPGAKRARLVGQAAFYVDGNDHLQVTAFNTAAGVSLICNGRALLLDGRIQSFSFAFTPNTAGTASSALSPMAQGWILDAVVSVSAGTPSASQTFVQLQVVRGAQGLLEVARLQQGFVTATISIRFPGEMQATSTTGPITARLFVGTQPAAGAQILETVPTGKTWKLHGIGLLLTTDAVVGARRPTFIIKDSLGNIFFKMSTPDTVAASSTQFYNLADTGARLGPDQAGVGYAVDLGSYVLPAGSTISTTCVAFDVGDQWSKDIINVEEY